MTHLARLLLSGLLLAFSASSSLAATATLYYADGSTAQRDVAITPLTQRDLGPVIGGATRGADITLNTSVLMTDPANNFEEIVSAAPGQEVSFTTRFNRLDSLEVPFPDLVGRLLITGIFAPTLGVQSIIQIPIEADDGNIVGIGVGATIPVDAALGPFPLVGLNRITGFATAEDTAITARLVDLPAQAQASAGATASALVRALVAN